MIKDFDKLIEKIYEADGLMLLLARHRENTPDEVVESLRSRIRQILEMTDSEQLQSVPFIPPLYVPDDTGEEQETDDPDDDESDSESNESEPVAESQTDNSIDPLVAPEVSSVNDTTDIIEIETIQDAIGIASEHPEILITADDENESKEEDDADNDNNAGKNTDNANPDDSYPEEELIIGNSADDNEDDDSTESSTGSVHTCNISRAFTINDKFRFKRELFGNSDAQYVETMDVLSAMTTLDEAEEYLYEDLNWDPENEDVIAFTDIITNYFNNSYGR